MTPAEALAEFDALLARTLRAPTDLEREMAASVLREHIRKLMEPRLRLVPPPEPDWRGM